MKDPKYGRNVNKYLKYSGIAFQLFALLLLSVYVGQLIDNRLGFEKPWVMLLLIILSFVGWVFKLMRDLERDDNS